MHTFNILMLVLFPLCTFSQPNVGQCALSCAQSATEILDASCDTEEWSCLCGNPAYINRLAKCVKTNCSSIEYDVTVMAIPEICEAITTISTSETATSGPEETSETLSSITSMTFTSVTYAVCTTDDNHHPSSPILNSITTSANSYASTMPQVTPSNPPLSASQSSAPPSDNPPNSGMTTTPTSTLIANAGSQGGYVKTTPATFGILIMLMIALSI